MKKTLFALAVLAIAAVGCSKKSGTTANTAYQYQYGMSQYQYQNGLCVMTSTGQQVDPSFCNNANGAYQYQNGMCVMVSTGQQVDPSLCNTAAGTYQYNSSGQCIMTSTGQQVDPSLCQTAQYPGYGGNYGGQCYGTYIYMQYGSNYPQYVNCAGANCRGYMLYQASTYQPVYCQ